MAEIKKDILYEVKVTDMNKLAELAQETENYQKQLKDIDNLQKKQLGRLTKDQRREKELIKQKLNNSRQYYREEQKNIKDQSGSLNDLRRQLAYQIKSLADMKDVGSDAWKANAAEVKKLRDEVANFEGQYGTFTRNVGNYSGAITDSFGQMGGAVGQVTGQLNQMTRMFSGAGGIVTGTLGAAAAAIAGYLKLWQGYMAGTAERQLELNTTTGYYKQLWQDMLKSFDRMQDRRRESGDATFLDKVGYLGQLLLGKEGAKEVEEYMKKVEMFRIDTNNALIKEAQDRLRYEELMSKAADEVNYKAEERLDFAETAEKILDQHAKRRLELREREFFLYKQEVEMSRSQGPEEEERLSQLAAAVFEAEAEFERRKLRGIRRQNEATRKLMKEEEERQKILEQQTKEFEKQLGIIEKLLGKTLGDIEKGAMGRMRGAGAADADIDIEGSGMVTPERLAINETGELIAISNLLWAAELAAAKNIEEGWRQTYENRLAALKQMHAQGDISEQAFAERKMQLANEVTDNFINTLKQAVGANAKAQQAIMLMEQIVAVRRAFLALTSTKAAVVEGTAQTAKIGFPQNIIPLALFAAQVAGLIAQISSFAGALKSNKPSLQMTKGFAQGGYTGDGDKYETAGVVHRGEYVVPKHIVQNPAYSGAISHLEAARMRGYADGGMVSARTDFGSMRDAMRELFRDFGEIPVMVSAKDISLKQDEVRKIRVRGDL